MEILIVAKTHMKTAACVGGFEINTKKNVRLLTSDGDNQPKDTEFEVGQIWDITYCIRKDITPPHNEDILIQTKRFIKKQFNLNDFLKDNATIWQGSPDDIFENKLLFLTGQSGYITKRVGIPSQSVGFWLSDTDLELTILSDKKHFFYFGEFGPKIFAFPFVGFKPIVDKLLKGTLIRVALARWWSPNPDIIEKRCYCQISGWYENGS